MSALIDKQYSTHLVLNLFLIFLRHGLPQGNRFSRSNEVCSFLIKLTLNELWAARNLGTFESKRPTVSVIVSKIMARMRHRVKAAFQFSPRSEFLKAWAFKNVLCSYTNQQLLLKVQL